MEEWATLTDNPLLLVLAGALLLAALVIWLLGRWSAWSKKGADGASPSNPLVFAFDDVHPSFGRVLKAYLAKHSLEELSAESDRTQDAIDQLREVARLKARQSRQSRPSISELKLNSESKSSDVRPAMLSLLRAIYIKETERSELPPDAIQELDRFLDFLTGEPAERL